MKSMTFLRSLGIVGFAIYFCGCSFCVLYLSGCSTPLLQAQVSSNEHLEVKPIQPSQYSAAKASSKLKIENTEAIVDDNNIYFPLRGTTVDSVGKDKLRLHAENLKQNQRQLVTLVGHFDDSGSRNYNLAITEERVEVVAKLLRSYGVSARQIRRQSDRRDMAPTVCSTPDCQQKMRRVELLYLN